MFEDVHGSKSGANTNNIPNKRSCKVWQLELTHFLNLFLNASIDVEFKTASYEDSRDYYIY